MSAHSHDAESSRFDRVRSLLTLATSTREHTEVLDQIVDGVLAGTNAEAGSLVIRAPDTGELQFEVVRGPRAEAIKQVRLEPGEGIVGWVIDHNEPALVPDVASDERFAPRVDHLVDYETRTVVACPVVVPDRVIGALELVNKKDRQPFTRADAELVQGAAAIVALHAENNRLNAWAQRKVRELTTLVEVERQLNSTLDRKELLQSIVEAAVRVAGGEAGSLLLVDPEVGDLYFEVATGEKAAEVRSFRVPRGRGIAGWVAEHGEPVLVLDTTQDARYDPMIARTLGYETRSLVGIPMILRGEVIGVIEALNLPRRIADPQEYLHVLTGFASQAASALDRARLYAELEQKVETTADELYAAYSRLSAQKKKTDAMIESLADGILVVDPADKVTLANRAAESLLGMPPGQEAEGRNLEELPGSEPLLPLFAEAVRKPRSVAQGEAAVGQVELRISATRVLDDEGRPLGTVGVLSDITHLKELNRLKTELLGIVSHELRSPLTSLKAAASMMLHDRKLDPATEQEFLEIMDDQCNRMNRMIGNLLNASRVDAGRQLEMVWSDVEPVDLVNHTATIMRVPASRHHLRVEVPAQKVPPIRADAEKLQQVLTNLLDNAFKYSPPGSEVVLKLEDEPDRIRLAVVDHGVGIPKSELPHVFDMFERTRAQQTRKAQGSGVGLYLCKYLAEAHGGTITVESEVGRGSTFTLTLPRHPEEQGEPSANPS